MEFIPGLGAIDNSLSITKILCLFPQTVFFNGVDRTDMAVVLSQ
jgi:hypothetical protein